MRSKLEAVQLLRKLESFLIFQDSKACINAQEWSVLWSAVTCNESCDHCSSGNLDWQHHEETLATPECWVPVCQDCGHQGQPE